MSLKGLKAAMDTALDWHQQSAEKKSLFVAKRDPEPKYKTLADFPSARVGRGGRRGGGGPERFARGDRCTHCHDLRIAEQSAYRLAGEPMPENVLFSWPLPDATGLRLDPKQKATVEKVWEDSPAARVGFQPGDEMCLCVSNDLLLAQALFRT